MSFAIEKGSFRSPLTTVANFTYSNDGCYKLSVFLHISKCQSVQSEVTLNPHKSHGAVSQKKILFKHTSSLAVFLEPAVQYITFCFAKAIKLTGLNVSQKKTVI